MSKGPARCVMTAGIYDMVPYMLTYSVMPQIEDICLLPAGNSILSIRLPAGNRVYIIL